MTPARSSVIHFVSRVGVSIIGFLGTIYLTQMLGAGVYGTYAVILSLVYWIMLPSNALSSAITKRVSEDDEPGAYLGAGFVATAVVLVLAVVGLVVFNQQIADYTETDAILLLAVIVIGRMVFPAVTGGLSGQRKVAYSGFLTLIEHSGRVALQVLLVFLGWGLLGVLVGYGVAAVTVSAAGLLFYDVIPRLPQKRHFRHLISYVRYSWLGSIKSNVAGAAVDVIFLKLFTTTTLVGVYQVSWNLAALFVMVSGSIQAVLFPEVSQLAEQGEYTTIRDMLEESLVFSGLFVTPGLVGAVLIGRRVLRIYGSEFVIGSTVLVILIIARMVSAFGDQFVSAINGVDRPDLAFRVNLALVVSNIVLDAVLIPLLGWIGAAIATTLAAMTTLSLGYFYLAKLIERVHIPIGEFGRQVVASALMGLVVAGVKPFFPPSSYLATFALVALGTATYSLAILALSPRVRKKAFSLAPIQMV